MYLHSAPKPPSTPPRSSAGLPHTPAPPDPVNPPDAAGLPTGEAGAAQGAGDRATAQDTAVAAAVAAIVAHPSFPHADVMQALLLAWGGWCGRAQDFVNTVVVEKEGLFKAYPDARGAFGKALQAAVAQQLPGALQLALARVIEDSGPSYTNKKSAVIAWANASGAPVRSASHPDAPIPALPAPTLAESVANAVDTVMRQLPDTAPMGHLLNALAFAWGRTYDTDPMDAWRTQPTLPAHPPKSFIAFIQTFNSAKQNLRARCPGQEATIAFNNAIRAALLARLPRSLQDAYPQWPPGTDYALQRQQAQQWVKDEQALFEKNLVLLVDRVAPRNPSPAEVLGLLAHTWGFEPPALPAPHEAIQNRHTLHTWQIEQQALIAKYGEPAHGDIRAALRERLLDALPEEMKNAYTQLEALGLAPAQAHEDPWELRWIRACLKNLKDL